MAASLKDKRADQINDQADDSDKYGCVKLNRSGGDEPVSRFSGHEQGLVGSEAWGLAPEIQDLADCLVSIPMREGVDSYSVNAAAAIALYELGRRWETGQTGAGNRS